MNISHKEDAWTEANPNGDHSKKVMNYKTVIKQREDEFKELIF